MVKTGESIDQSIVDFAKSKNFSYEPGRILISNSEPGSLYRYEKALDFYESNIFIGETNGYSMKISDLHYKLSYLKTGNDYTYQVRIARVELPQKLSNIVIDCTVESGIINLQTNLGVPDPNGSVLPITFDPSQKMELEGSFHDYFDVYAPVDVSSDVQAILTPDVMEFLVNTAALCDIEIVDNYVYFYWADGASMVSNYEKLLVFVDDFMQLAGGVLSQDGFTASGAPLLVENTEHDTAVLKQDSMYGVIPTWMGVSIVIIAAPIVVIFLLYNREVALGLGGKYSWSDAPILLKAGYIMLFAGFLMAVVYCVIEAAKRSKLSKKFKDTSKK
ncbi:hypothetical protein A3F64_03065 [Candidatus Saccharibacteria bacterium RIFCSPHIGHO2_12_FULL_42_8]|nr:MAG: hypothetical protein A3F64_03065 [Candidatus Saccharibacteria bacterium RIFCSPHIGHO2_12_FULL_42_8]